MLNGGTGSDVVNLWAHDWDGTGVSVKMTSAVNGTATIDFTGTTETARFSSFETVWTHEGRDTIDGSGADIGLNAAGFHAGTRWGNDVLIGSAGRDTLEGGEGRDTITGGRGNDLISANGDFFPRDAARRCRHADFPRGPRCRHGAGLRRRHRPAGPGRAPLFRL
ncbi:hypothetical protein DPM13_11945 [Paracoccus mutanolyticus]|uniref:Calcium-binding protein n=1 Tax=Paracoccus mutanolyticus TaxID=1499308 RepID=A0ABN5MCK5_9RHOB|nr:hypothetical protein [Paracoccus mutanolyticus]AWX93563.1 hypothetical protein DPM13_11945 [Paracoccus mutanolyticus]